jgi:hypothetical protein
MGRPYVASVARTVDINDIRPGNAYVAIDRRTAIAGKLLNAQLVRAGSNHDPRRIIEVQQK